MNIKIVKVGYLETNCYILKKNNKALIIDPGDEYQKIKNELKNLIPLAILITHHHEDHIGALNRFKNIKILDNNNIEEKEYQIEDFKFKVIKTKGHTNDSISFYFEKEKIMFVGDFIFKNSIGRTDLKSGNEEEMKKSIDRIKEYPEEIEIYPGHGEKTNLKEEIKNNPFF
jgi:glyoxylase-like metal-dependent hydrolase (beta-lactamase superfamily II)